MGAFPGFARLALGGVYACQVRFSRFHGGFVFLLFCGLPRGFFFGRQGGRLRGRCRFWFGVGRSAFTVRRSWFDVRLRQLQPRTSYF